MCLIQVFAMDTLAWNNVKKLLCLIVLAYKQKAVINRDRLGHLNLIVRGEILGFVKD